MNPLSLRRAPLRLLLTLPLVALAACGGGGSDDDGADQPETEAVWDAFDWDAAEWA